MQKQKNISIRLADLQGVLSVFVLIKLYVISMCKHLQYRNNFVDLWYVRFGLFNITYSFILCVSNKLETISPQVFAGFCVSITLSIALLVTINIQIVHNPKPLYHANT